MIAAVYRFENDMLMVFDDRGEQMTELQGRWSPELELKIHNASCGLTAWHGFSAGKRVNWKQYREQEAALAAVETP